MNCTLDGDGNRGGGVDVALGGDDTRGTRGSVRSLERVIDFRRRTGPRLETIDSADASWDRSESHGFPAVRTGSSRAEIQGSESKLITRGAIMPSGRMLYRRRRGVRGGQPTCRLIELQGVGD
jgi:hypothetical protein